MTVLSGARACVWNSVNLERYVIRPNSDMTTPCLPQINYSQTLNSGTIVNHDGAGAQFSTIVTVILDRSFNAKTLQQLGTNTNQDAPGTKYDR